MSAVDEALTLELNRLAERDRFVLVRRYGLDDGRARTLQVIGDALGLTRERIRQLQKRALGRLTRRQRNPRYAFVPQGDYEPELWNPDGVRRLFADIEKRISGTVGMKQSAGGSRPSTQAQMTSPETMRGANESVDNIDGPGRPRSPSIRVDAWLEAIRRAHPRAYEAWTPQEEAHLRGLFAEGKSIPEIAADLGRQTGGVDSRLRRLGLLA
ncbi:MAG: hypothetical protein HY874_03035 [Chloroflexi bacterium]|nr:hypothetical protein [Chloroflexota bacterium]